MTGSQDTALSAVAYVQRGWAVVPLHDVTGGTCSCGSADPTHDPKQGGKHPIARGWQNNGIRDPAAAMAAWAARPGANVGIVTGRASGIWVLDVDPDNGGDRQLAGLIAAFGPLPETYTVSTGSGGTHHYWRMPEFDFTTSSGRLPLGLDVRGNAGQVVAPPSYTLKGPYRVLHDPGYAVEAPGWLLGMIRPPERVEPGGTGGGAAEGAGGFTWAARGLDAASTLDRGPAYARSAVTQLFGQLAGAGIGERNTTAYRVARRLSELVCSSWAGLGDGSAVWAGYMAAAARADVDGGFSQTEAQDVLGKAWRDQAGRGVDLPAPDHLGTVMPWVPAPSVTHFDQAGQDPAEPRQLINGPSDLPDPFELAVGVELGRMIVREEARRRMTERDRTRRDFSAEVLDDDALAALPPPIPLINDWLYVDTLARMNGPSGEGKSFVAMEIAGCVANGVAWHGHPVRRGEVLYVVAEGASGANARFQAWQQRHGLERHNVKVITAPVQSVGPDWADFVTWCGQVFRPTLIVLDTQARHTEGVNENDAGEMGLAVAAWEALRAATGACVLLVHHRGVGAAHGRGSTAVRGAMTTELDVSKASTTVTVRVTKQKDAVEALALTLTLNPLGASAVLIGMHDTAPTTADGPAFVAPVIPISSRERCALAIAHALIDAAGSGLTKSEAQTNARVSIGLPGTETVRRTLRRAWSDLMDLGRIAKAPGREAFFFLELEGLSVLGANPDKAVQGGPEVYLP